MGTILSAFVVGAKWKPWCTLELGTQQNTDGYYLLCKTLDLSPGTPILPLLPVAPKSLGVTGLECWHDGSC